MVQLNQYRDELKVFNSLEVFAFDSLIDDIRDSGRKTHTAYFVLSSKSDDIIATNSLFSDDVNYHFAIEKCEVGQNRNICYYFNISRLVIADLLARVIINPPANKSEFIKLLNLLNRDYRQYVDVDVLEVCLFTTYYDQKLMNLVYNIIWRKDNKTRRREFLTFLEASKEASRGVKIDTNGNKIKLLLLIATKKQYYQREIVKKI